MPGWARKIARGAMTETLVAFRHFDSGPLASAPTCVVESTHREMKFSLLTVPPGAAVSDSTSQKSWAILDLLNWTTDYFAQAGIENPRLNAELLLGKVLQMERIMLYARFEQEVSEKARDGLRELVRRRKDRCPLQYLLGETEFYGRRFIVTPAVMVPRQETELVVGKCLEKLPPDQQDLWAADVGTGSGIIAITLAAERPALHVVATDTSDEALEVASRNAAQHGVSIRVARGELTHPLGALLPNGRSGYNVLVSNPPYIPTRTIEKLAPEVRDYEPRASLDGGPEGLDVIRKLVAQAPGVLCEGGWLIMELGDGQSANARRMLEETERFSPEHVEFERDGSGCERVVAAQLNLR